MLSSADASHACASDEINEITARLDARGQPHLAAADDSGAVYVMNAVTGKLVKVIRRHSMFASCVDFRPAVGQLEFVSGGFDCTALVW